MNWLVTPQIRREYNTHLLTLVRCAGKRPSSPSNSSDAKRLRPQASTREMSRPNAGGSDQMEETIPLSMMDLRALTKLEGEYIMSTCIERVC